MANLLRNQFQKEHNQVTTATAGSTSYVLPTVYQGAVVKVEFANAAAVAPSCVIKVLWTALDATTKQFQQQTCVNLDIQSDTLETNYRHGQELTFNSAGAKTLRVDVQSITGSGAISVWVAGR